GGSRIFGAINLYRPDRHVPVAPARRVRARGAVRLAGAIELWRKLEIAGPAWRCEPRRRTRLHAVGDRGRGRSRAAGARFTHGCLVAELGAGSSLIRTSHRTQRSP